MGLLAKWKGSISYVLKYGLEMWAKRQRQEDALNMDEDENELYTLPRIGLGCIVYMVVVHQVHLDAIPSVLNPGWLLKACLPYLISMFFQPGR
jgi:hypothetical protein